MHGLCFDYTMQDWFDFEVPSTSIIPNFLADILDSPYREPYSPKARVVWLGGSLSSFNQSTNEYIVHNKTFDLPICLDDLTAEWLLNNLPKLSLKSDHKITMKELAKDYHQQNLGDFNTFWKSKTMQELRANGLLVI